MEDQTYHFWGFSPYYIETSVPSVLSASTRSTLTIHKRDLLGRHSKRPLHDQIFVFLEDEH